MAHEFWDQWIKFYLPALILCKKWTKVKQNIKIGDLVILKDSSILKASGAKWGF